MNKTYIYAAFFAACLLLLAMWCFQIPSRLSVAEAYSVDDLASDDVVSFYEKSIAGENFITGMSEFRRERMRETYSVSDKKLNALLIIQDLGARTGDIQNLSDLSRMNDRQLTSVGKRLIKAYIASLSDEKKSELKQQWRDRKN